ncbi:MAG TPA: SH3 domain-containing protein [Candidatus Excrementavichristensenella intestinipullorum]|nr:SH3 domain-containing protein [Candidatus Excrementavichristensenella intestinipullorum]
MKLKGVLALGLALAALFWGTMSAAQETGLRDSELSRAELFGLIQGEEDDPDRPVTPQEGLTMVAGALALSLGARDASFDNLAQSAPAEGELKVRELCMALSRAGARMGVPVRSNLPEPALLSGTIGRSSYFATRDAPYEAPNGKTYENELLYAVAFACGTPSMISDLPLVDVTDLLNQGLEAPCTWAQTVAAALRLYEAAPQVASQAGQQDGESVQDASSLPQEDLDERAQPSPTPAVQDTPAPEASPAPEATPAPISWIEVTAPLVNIRSAASLEAEVLSQASQGERYHSFGLTADGWYIIEYAESAIGYISADYCKEVQMSDAEEGEVIGTVTVLTTSVFVRDQPSNAGTAVYTATKGQSFECLGREGSGWYKIRYGQGSVGYIYHRNCALTWFS